MNRNTISKLGCCVLLLLLGLLLLPSAGLAGSNGPKIVDAQTVTTKAKTVATSLAAYARVEPIAIMKLKAAQTGIIDAMAVVPGQKVSGGTVLGHLAGPAVDAMLAHLRNSTTAARAALQAARKILASQRRRLAGRLATQEAFYQAEADLARAKAGVDDARSQLRAAQASLVLKAPGDGIVLTVNATAGDRVQAGDTILTLQPAGGLWLVARYYGADASAVRPGVAGRFEPAAGGAAIPVKVRTLIGPVAPDGGLAVGLAATAAAPDWLNGEAGRVTLAGPDLTGVAVPTRALILDAGRWWILERTKDGDRRRQVVPGPHRGTLTLVRQGIEPGTRVVVENAYLEFHRDFARHYQPPD